MFEDDEEDDCGHDHGNPPPPEKQKSCQLCLELLQVNDMLHPILLNLGEGSTLLIFLHDRCYRRTTEESLADCIRNAKYDMLLRTADEDIGEC